MKFDKRTYTFLGVGVGLILLLYVVSLLLSGEEKVDFRETFEGNDKIPYGTYLLKNSLPSLFEVDTLIEQEKSLFDLLALNEYEDVSYLIINNQFPALGIDVEELLYFIRNGNHVFLSVRSLGATLNDSLNLVQMPYSDEEKDSVNFLLTQKNTEAESYTFPRFGMRYFIPGIDSLYPHEVLVKDEKDNPVLLKYPIGKGYLVLSSTPRIFSNYYMVQEKPREFIASAFRHLPQEGEVWWDEFYKREKLRFKNLEGGNGGGSSNSSGFMDYILSQEGLRWAFWLSLLALLVYAIFESKRKQRIIPIIEPLPNLTLDFTETVGRLYFRSSANKEIAEKRIRALLGHIRSAYFLKTDKFDDKFLKSLSAKSSIPETDIKVMFRLIDRIRTSEEISESQLIEINHFIDVFYKIGAR